MTYSPPVKVILILLTLVGQTSSDSNVKDPSGSPQLVPERLIFNETELCSSREENVKVSESILSVMGDSVFDVRFTTSHNLLITYRPTELGLSEGTITVETASGVTQYEVVGNAIPNNYGVQPISAIIPKGSVYTANMMLYNPHPSHSLTIVSCTTESQFVLLNNTALGSWSLSPHQQSVFASASIMPIFTGAPEGLITLEILKQPILSSHSSSSSDVVELTEEDHLFTIDIPVSYEYASNGLYHVKKNIDLGSLTDVGKVHSRSIIMLNTFSDSMVTIESVTWTDHSNIISDDEDDERAIQLITSSHSTTIPPGHTSSVATLLFTASYTGTYNGQITVNYSTPDNPVKSVVVPFRARVLFGSITYNSNATMFMCSNQGDSLKRAKPANLFLTNNFNVPVKVTGAVVSSIYYTLVGGIKRKVIMPGESQLVTTIKYLPTSSIFVAGNLTIQTNLTQIKVPLQSYHGKLTLSTGTTTTSDVSVLALKAFTKPVVNLGMVSIPSEKSLKIELGNPNPIPINIISITKGVIATVSPLQRSDRKLQPRQTIPVSISVNISTEGVSKDKVIIVSPFQVMEVVVTCLGVYGETKFINHETQSEINIHQPLTINNVLLGSTGEAPIFISSTHQDPMLIDNITISDPRVTVQLSGSLVVVPGAVTDIGRVIVSPVDVDSDRRLKKEKTSPAFRRKTLSNEDVDLFKAVQVANSIAGQSISAVISIVITDSSLLFQKTLQLHVKSIPEKAEIIHSKHIDFGRLTVGSTSEQYITVMNPSRTDLHLQIIKWGDIPIPLLVALQNSLNITTDPGTHENEFGIASQALRKVVLSPGEVISLGPIYYKATKLSEVTTAFVIRNSLSGIETVHVKGSGGQGNLILKSSNGENNTMEIRPSKTSFAKWSPPGRQRGEFISFVSVLKLFLHGVSWLNSSYIVPQHFEDYSAPGAVSKYMSDPVSFTKVFNIVNSGNHHINITSAMLTAYDSSSNVRFADGSHSCDNVRGITLRDCGVRNVRMFLPPDGQGSIAFKFSPDFTSDTVRAVLHLGTDEGPTFTFRVVGLLPRDLLLIYYDTVPHTLSETCFRAATIILLLALGLLLFAHVISVELFDKEPASIVDLSVFVAAKNSIITWMSGFAFQSSKITERTQLKNEIVEDVVKPPTPPTPQQVQLESREEIRLKTESTESEVSTLLQTATPEERSPASSEASPTSAGSAYQLTEQALSKKLDTATSNTNYTSEARSLTPTSERILDGSSLSMLTNTSITSSSKGDMAPVVKEKLQDVPTKTVKRATKERDRELKREKQRLADEKRRKQLQEKARFEEEERLQVASERAASLKLQQEREEEKRRVKLQREEEIRKEAEKKLLLQKQREREKREREEREREERRKNAERAEKERTEAERQRRERERRGREEKAARLKAEAAREKTAALAAAKRERETAELRDTLWQVHQRHPEGEIKHPTPPGQLLTACSLPVNYEDTFQPLGVTQAVRQSDVGDFWVRQPPPPPLPQQQFVHPSQQQNVIHTTQQMGRQFQQPASAFTTAPSQQQPMQNSWPVQGHQHHQQQQQQHLLKQVMQQHNHQQHHSRQQQPVLPQVSPPPLVTTQPSGGFSLFQGGGGSADFVNELVCFLSVCV